MIIKNRTKRTYEFYTQTELGVETLIATKTLKHPDKCALYKKMQNDGFKDGVHRYGWRIKE